MRKRANVKSRIGLISDVHATCAPVKEALSIFREQHVDKILCAGDTAGYGTELDQTVKLLMESDCTSILGNHEIWYLEAADAKHSNGVAEYFNGLSQVLDTEIAGKSLYMVHASPPQSYMDGIKLLDEHGKLMADRKQEWTKRLRSLKRDILVVGHTHQILCERLGDTLVVNPGSTKFNHSCAILTLPDMTFELFALSNKQLSYVWNWGLNEVHL
jgi:putative phosphoesterase